MQGRRLVVVAWKNQREYDGGWNIPGPIFGRPGADQASSLSGMLHDLNGGRTTLLVPPGPRSQRRSLGRSNVTQINLEARPWLVDFHAAAALDCFTFFWVFLLGLYLVFSAF